MTSGLAMISGTGAASLESDILLFNFRAEYGRLVVFLSTHSANPHPGACQYACSVGDEWVGD